jgi:hypothetical protein
MNRKLTAILIIWMIAQLLASTIIEAQTLQGKTQSITPQAGGNAVNGNGTTGRIAKWTGVDSANTYTLGNSAIFEDKFAKVGIGTINPTSMLTVQGMIETTLGGYKFPDGTVQTTAANGLSSVFHNATLTGNGTNASPLGIAVPLELTANSSESLGFTFKATNTGNGSGVEGTSVNGNGIKGRSTNEVAIDGTSTNFTGVYGGGPFAGVIGESSSVGVLGGSFFSDAVRGETTSGIAIHGHGGVQGLAGKFEGNVEVTGNISKGGGSFKIDHPLDPENKYLYHSFVESPDMKNIYDGNVTTDENGEAIVKLPDYFDTLNKDFRYQLTVIGTFAQAIIYNEIKDNRFVIKTNGANVKVSWQVTGIRQDAFANKNRIPTEELKKKEERGLFLHPEAFGESPEKAIGYKEHKEITQRLKIQKQSNQ